MNGATISIDATKNEIDFLITVAGADRCFDDQTVAVAFFEGGRQRFNLRNAATMNCEGLFHTIGRNTQVTPSFLSRLMRMKVASFKITGRDKKEIEITLTPEQQQQFFDLCACIAAEAKTLLPPPPPPAPAN